MHSVNLSQAVKMWPTPIASDGHAKGYRFPSVERRREIGKAISLAMDVQEPNVGGQLNPDWVEWLMGWPLFWTSLEKMPTFAYQQWQDETGNRKEAGAADVSDEAMRNVWWNNDPSAAPCRWRCDEQRPKERESALPKVPHEGPHDDRELGEGISADSGLSCMWTEFQAEENETGKVVWKCGVCQRTRPKGSRVAMGVAKRVDRLKAIGNGQVPAAAALAWNTLYERIQKH